MKNTPHLGPSKPLPFHYLDKEKRVPWNHQNSGSPKGICVLCRKEKRLKLSHLIPRHFFKDDTKALFYADAKFSENHVDFENGGINKNIQDGSKFYLLCDQCEQHFGKAEDKLVRFHRNLYSNFPIALSNSEMATMFTAVCGIAFRTYWAHRLFLKINPGWPSYLEKRMRKQLLENDPIGFFIGGARLREEDIEVENGRNLFIGVPQLIPFNLSKIKGGPIFRAVFGEAEWIIAASRPYRNGFFEEKSLEQMLGASQLELLRTVAESESKWLDKRLGQ